MNGHSVLRFVLGAMALLTLSCEACAANAPDVVYLSDVVLGISKYPLDYTKMLGLDTTSYPLWPKVIPGQPLSIAGQSYAKGVGAPNGEIVVVLDGQYELFEAQVGVQTGDQGIAIFTVSVDGQRRFESGEMKDGDAAKPVSVSLVGAQQMTMTAASSARANWADARLVRAAGTTAADAPDMAPFARVVTWDPARADGVRVNRLTEFPAEDVFLESPLSAQSDGTYVVPIAADGTGCIGLEWLETRRLARVGIEFAGAHRPAPDAVRVEAWAKRDPLVLDGHSPWQGKWVPLASAVQADGALYTWELAGAANREVAQGAYKVRWLFPATGAPVCVRKFIAHTTSRWAETHLVLEALPGASEPVSVEIYNGAFLADPAADSARRQVTGTLAAPLALDVRYTTPRPWLFDRTVLRISTPAHALGVAVDDVLQHGVVYVEPAGLVVRTPTGNVAEARRRAEAEPTVLEQVRTMPDQSLAQALAVNYLPVQNRSPTMLSLPADNRKVMVQRGGEVGFGPTYLDFVQQRSRHRLAPTFGSGQQHAFSDTGAGEYPGYSRRLEGGWLPMPHIRVEEGGVVYHQIVCVAPWDRPGAQAASRYLHPTPLCVVQYVIENGGAASVPAAVTLKMVADAEHQRPASLEDAGAHVLVRDGQQVLAVLERPPAPLTCTADGDRVQISGACPPQTSLTFFAFLPLQWTLAPDEISSLAAGPELRQRAQAYWEAFMAPAMQVDVPDEMLASLLRASQVHCALAARNEADGARIDAWISSSYYASLDTESHAILHGMDLWGQHDFARRTLEFFLARHQEAGYLSHGYTLMGTGQHLWWAADHYRLTADEAWWREVAPRMAKMCRWVVAQTAKTRRCDATGTPVPQYGLVPPGTVADWQDWGYTYSLNGYYYAGLAHAARALAAIEHPEAGRFAEAAEEFRHNIRRAYAWTTARASVVQRRDGAWIPASPFQALCPGPSPQFFPNYSGSWIYDAELGAHHLIDQGVLEPQSAPADFAADYLEDRQFIDEDFGVVRAEATRRDWFNRGGFGRAQPYYGRFVQMHGHRDDVKPFVRSYFNQLAAMLNREDLSLYENPGASVWNKTFETGNFLQQSRMMFVMERGDALWLAPFVTTQWMQDGMHVAVRNAPTCFGPVSYRIESHVSEGFVKAVVEPVTRTQPESIVLRLRHPDGRRMKSVTLDGQPHAEFDPNRETITFTPGDVAATVRANFE